MPNIRLQIFTFIKIYNFGNESEAENERVNNDTFLKMSLTAAPNYLFPEKYIPGKFLSGWHIPGIKNTSIPGFSQREIFMN